MSLKGTQTTTDYIPFEVAESKANELIRKNDVLGLYIMIAINTGMRIGDLRELTYEELQKDELNIIEGKTKKPRKIVLNERLKEAISKFSGTGLIFVSQKGKVYATQSINRLLKKHFDTKDRNISSHSLRKTFGRRVYDRNEQSEQALMYLSELLNHSSIAITRRYLGIRQEELNDIYYNL